MEFKILNYKIQNNKFLDNFNQLNKLCKNN